MVVAVSKAATMSLSTWPTGCVCMCTGALRWEAPKQQQKWWWAQPQESKRGTAFKWDSTGTWVVGCLLPDLISKSLQ